VGGRLPGGFRGDQQRHEDDRLAAVWAASDGGGCLAGWAWGGCCGVCWARWRRSQAVRRPGWEQERWVGWRGERRVKTVWQTGQVAVMPTPAGLVGSGGTVVHPGSEGQGRLRRVSLTLAPAVAAGW
jgi:hypothetical protein